MLGVRIETVSNLGADHDYAVQLPQIADWPEAAGLVSDKVIRVGHLSTRLQTGAIADKHYVSILPLRYLIVKTCAGLTRDGVAIER